MNTIYINNLNEKVSVNTLKRELQTLLSSYSILDIHIKKSIKKKGQAFVSFKNENLEPIINKYNNYKLLGKPIRVTKAKQDSYELLSQAVIDAKINSKKYKVFNKPSKMLILQYETQLQKDQTASIFNRYPGFVDFRVIGAKNIAFVEFETVQNAEHCMSQIDIEEMKKINGKLSFAKD